jgi:hypothetical protein
MPGSDRQELQERVQECVIALRLADDALQAPRNERTLAQLEAIGAVSSLSRQIVLMADEILLTTDDDAVRSMRDAAVTMGAALLDEGDDDYDWAINPDVDIATIRRLLRTSRSVITRIDTVRAVQDALSPDPDPDPAMVDLMAVRATAVRAEAVCVQVLKDRGERVPRWQNAP